MTAKKISSNKSSPKTFPLNSSFYTPHRIKLSGRNIDKKENSSFGVLTATIADELRAFLPPIQKESKEWNLIYSTEQHGISVNTMFQNILKWETSPSLTPCVLALKTTSGSIFGSFLSEAPTRKKGYYGNGHCFLWKETAAGSLTAYLSTGQNEHYILSEQGACLALGGGENGFSLWVDEGLLKASSNRSKTFGNEPLSEPSNFELEGLELWAISI